MKVDVEDEEEGGGGGGGVRVVGAIVSTARWCRLRNERCARPPATVQYVRNVRADRNAERHPKDGLERVHARRKQRSDDALRLG